VKNEKGYQKRIDRHEAQKRQQFANGIGFREINQKPHPLFRVVIDHYFQDYSLLNSKIEVKN
jgi:hypothetical protein